MSKFIDDYIAENTAQPKVAKPDDAFIDSYIAEYGQKYAQPTPPALEDIANEKAKNWQTYVDERAKAEADPYKPQSSTSRRVIGDPLVALANGLMGVGETAVGLLNIPTLGYAGKGYEAIGGDFKKSKEMISSLYSADQKEANRKAQEADGFWNTVRTMIQNPSTISNAVIESAPTMLGGGAISKGVIKLAPKFATVGGRVIAGAIGEGAVTAGQNIEQVRQQTDTGTLTLGQDTIVTASGAATGIISLLGGKLANRLGLDDLQILMAGGKTQDKLLAKKSIITRIIADAISEGALQELPQSAQEQFAQNVALGKKNPMEGVAEAAANGMMTGAFMGAGAAYVGRGAKQQPPPASKDAPQSPTAGIPPVTGGESPIVADAQGNVVTPEGTPVTDENGNPIVIPDNNMESTVPTEYTDQGTMDTGVEKINDVNMEQNPQTTIQQRTESILADPTTQTADKVLDEVIANKGVVAEPVPVAPSRPVDNIYLRMPIDRVKQDAENGVTLAQEALAQRQAEIAPVAPPVSPTPVNVSQPVAQPSPVEPAKMTPVQAVAEDPTVKAFNKYVEKAKANGISEDQGKKLGNIILKAIADKDIDTLRKWLNGVNDNMNRLFTKVTGLPAKTQKEADASIRSFNPAKWDADLKQKEQARANFIEEKKNAPQMQSLQSHIRHKDKEMTKQAFLDTLITENYYPAINKKQRFGKETNQHIMMGQDGVFYNINSNEYKYAVRKYAEYQKAKPAPAPEAPTEKPATAKKPTEFERVKARMEAADVKKEAEKKSKGYIPPETASLQVKINNAEFRMKRKFGATVPDKYAEIPVVKGLTDEEYVKTINDRIMDMAEDSSIEEMGKEAALWKLLDIVPEAPEIPSGYVSLSELYDYAYALGEKAESPDRIPSNQVIEALFEKELTTGNVEQWAAAFGKGFSENHKDANELTAKKPETKWTEIGKNVENRSVFEDEKGTRSYTDGSGFRTIQPQETELPASFLTFEEYKKKYENKLNATAQVATPAASPVKEQPARKIITQAEYDSFDKIDLVDDLYKAMEKAGLVTDKIAKQYQKATEAWRNGDGDVGYQMKMGLLDQLNRMIERQPKPAQVAIKSPLANLSTEEQARLKAIQDRIAQITMKRASMGLDPELIPLGVEMVNLYAKGGIRTFSQFAARVKADMAGAWDNLKGYLHGIWQTAGANDNTLDDVSRTDASKIIAEIDKPTESAVSDPLHTLVDMIVTELDNSKSLNNQALTELARKAYGGTRGEGKYNVRDAYDAMEAAVNKHIEKSGIVNFNDPSGTIKRLQELTDRLARQTDRNEDQKLLQQFSTPPSEAFAVVYAAGIKKGMKVLEPSAGTGNIAMMAKLAGADVQANEIDPRRRQLLEYLGFKTTGYNGEQLDNFMGEDDFFDVVTMNPPFSSTGGRVAKNDTKYGARHVEQALYRLKQGGRLVAIVGNGMDHARPNFSDWWIKIENAYNVRANLGMDGKTYGKYGTTFDNNIIVIDKNNVTPGLTRAEKVGNILQCEKLSPAEAVEKLKSIANEDVNERINQQPESASQKTPKGMVSQEQGSTSPERNPGTDLPVSNKGKRGRGNKTQPDTGQGDNQDVHGSNVQSDGRKGANESTSPELQDQGANTTIQQGADGKGRMAGTGDIVNDRGIESGSLTMEPDSNTKLEEENSTYSKYRPTKFIVKNAAKHPADLVEATSLASTELPDITYKPSIPQHIIDEGRLSDAQLEAMALAGQRHETILPNGSRAEFIIGDGTGVGKGREIAAIILDRENKGMKKAVWISADDGKLDVQAKRDLEQAGSNLPLIPLYDYDMNNDIPGDKGVLFLNYNKLAYGWKKGRERFNQIAKWLGDDFDGVITFDEAHMMKNAMGTGVGGQIQSNAGTDTGAAGLELKRMFPNARIVNVSATIATVPRNLAFLSRLGLWGDNSPFHDFMEFLDAVHRGGIGAMEMLSRDLKSLGAFVARNISYKDVVYDKLVHNLSSDEIKMYNDSADLWANLLKKFNEAADNANQPSKGFTQFFAIQQRFFLKMITAFQVNDTIKAAEQDLKDGKQVVISLYGTGEQDLKREQARRAREGVGADEEINMSPNEMLANMVQRFFPVEEYEDQTDPATGRTVKVATGQMNRQNMLEREKMLDLVRNINLPDNPLDVIVNHFGGKVIAEISGRQIRIENGKIVKRKIEGVRNKDLNAHEQEVFQKGKKKIAVISGSASTGIDLHADNKIKNKNQRVFYALELSWSADKQMQSFGRVHRSFQFTAPIIKLVETDLKGQQRLVATTAKRLASLGAMAKGERKSLSGGLFKDENIMDEYGESAVGHTLTHLPREILERMDLLDKNGNVKDSAMDDVDKFLNRILVLPFKEQNEVFEKFYTEYQRQRKIAEEQGVVSGQVENLEGKNIRLSKPEETVYTYPGTNAHTKLVELQAEHEVMKLEYKSGENYYRNIKSGKIYWVTNSYSNDEKWLRNPMGNEHKVEDYKITDPDLYEKLDGKIAKKEWNAELDAHPDKETRNHYILTGAIFPIYDKIFTSDKIRHRILRAQTSDGKSYLGIEVPQDSVTSLKARLGIGTALKDATPEEIFDMVYTGGSVVVLDNDWKIAKTVVHGEERIEIKGGYLTKTESDNIGLIKEEIGWNNRYFIPTDKEIGIPAMEKLLDLHKAVEDITQSAKQFQSSPTSIHITPAQANMQIRKLAANIGGTVQGLLGKVGSKITLTLKNGFTITIEAMDSLKDDKGDTAGGFIEKTANGYRVGYSLKDGRLTTIPHEALGHVAWNALSEKERTELHKFLGTATDEQAVEKLATMWVNKPDGIKGMAYLAWTRFKRMVENVGKFFGANVNEGKRLAEDIVSGKMIKDSLNNQEAVAFQSNNKEMTNEERNRILKEIVKGIEEDRIGIHVNGKARPELDIAEMDQQQFKRIVPAFKREGYEIIFAKNVDVEGTADHDVRGVLVNTKDKGRIEATAKHEFFHVLWNNENQDAVDLHMTISDVSPELNKFVNRYRAEQPATVQSIYNEAMRELGFIMQDLLNPAKKAKFNQYVRNVFKEEMAATFIAGEIDIPNPESQSLKEKILARYEGKQFQSLPPGTETRLDRNPAIPVNDPQSRDKYTDNLSLLESPEVRRDKEVEIEAKIRIGKNHAGEMENLLNGRLFVNTSDTDMKVARLLLEQLYKDKSPEGIKKAKLATYNYAEIGTEIARALRQRRDSRETPAQRALRILNSMMYESTPEMKKKLKEAETVDAKMKLLDEQMKNDDWSRIKARLEALRFPTDFDKMTDAQLQDPILMGKILAVFSQERASWQDKIMEYYRNALMSLPTTFSVNMGSNIVNVGSDFAVNRLIEGAIGDFVSKLGYKGNIQTTGELKYIQKYMGLAWATGKKNALLAWQTERSQLEGSMLEEPRTHIGGAKGWWARTPQRANTWADEYIKGVIWISELAAQAYRSGLQQGLKDGSKEMDLHVDGIVNNPTGTVEEQRALEKAKDLTFQQSNGFAKRFIDMAVKARNVPGIGLFIGLQLPFIQTPVNIVTQGIRKTPLGLIGMGVHGLKGDYASRPDLLIKHSAEQIIAAGLTLALYSLIKGMGGDGDDKDDPLITGSRAFERGKKESQYRTIPPQSVYLPGLGRYVSYSRVEPFATMLTPIIDLLELVHEGKNASYNFKRAFSTLVSPIRDKTFLQGITAIIDAIEQPQQRLERLASNQASAFMPNIVKGSFRAFDPYYREISVKGDYPERFKELGKRTLQAAVPYVGTNPPPKVDIWGRDVTKMEDLGQVGDILWRLIVPAKMQSVKSITNYDRLLINYNNSQKDESKEYWPTIPTRDILKNKGKSWDMTDAQMNEYLKIRGERVITILNRREFNFDNPTDRDIKKVKEAFRVAGEYAKSQMIRSGEVEQIAKK